MKRWTGLGRRRWATLLLGLMVSGGLAARAAEVTVDFSQTRGAVRPLHGVNLGPLCLRGTVDLSAYHRELAVPLTRLHDVVWLQADAVDLSSIFRDWRNDPAQAASYDFAATDDYLQAIVRVGSRIVYRLGESIEHTPRKYRVHPPPDPARWAAVCLGVIRHYNEGWAGGFQYDIPYWEIWNEPDVRPAMWTGTDEQYFHLYEVAAKTIKARFPHLKVGGPALGGTGEFSGETFQPAPFLTNFLAQCRQRGAPLDFFSWHRYTSDPWDLPRRARAVRRLLDEAGFARAESHLNEWNYLPQDDWQPMLRGQGAVRARWYEDMAGPAGAAFAACGLMLLQDSPVEAANFYTGAIASFGLFDLHGTPQKVFYAFKAFRQLLDTPERVPARGAVSGQLALLAGLAKDRQRAGILISHFKGADAACSVAVTHLPWPGPTAWELFAVDGARNLDRVRRGEEPGRAFVLRFDLPAPAVGWLTLRPAAAN